jgi:YjbE family integral membrane protein
MTFVLALLGIIGVNIVLSGDNAVVIALACRTLPKKLQKIAILWGCAGAVILRIILTLGVVLLLRIPYLQFIGGLLLVWISVKLLVENEEHSEVKCSSSFWGAVRTIIVADIIMSLDNTLAIVAVANGDIILIVFGLVLSVPIIIFGSQIIMKMMDRFPIIVYVGAGLIAWTAGEMLIRDTKVSVYLPDFVNHWLPLGVTVLVIAGGWLYNRIKLRSSKDVLEADKNLAKKIDNKID